MATGYWWANSVRVPSETTIILRPRVICHGTYDHVPDVSGAHFLEDRRIGEERIDLAFRKQLNWLDV